MLVFIEGGPEMFANQAFDVGTGDPEKDLLQHPEFVKHLQEYRWTSRTIRSKNYPDKVAQVWRHVSVEAEEVEPRVQPIPSAADDKNSLASDDTVREAGDDTPLPMKSETAPERAARLSTERMLGQSAIVTGSLQREARATVALDGETQVIDTAPRTVQPAERVVEEPAGADYTGEPVQTEGDSGDLPSGEQLFLARKRRKLTVQQVADEVGLKRSRVDAIEKGEAKRGDVAGDLRKVHEFLNGSTSNEATPGGEVEAPRE